MQYLEDGVLILPTDYLSPISYSSGEKHITSNTISVHWFAASWLSSEKKKLHSKKLRKRKKDLRKQSAKDAVDYFIHIPNLIIMHILGPNKYSALKEKIKR